VHFLVKIPEILIERLQNLEPRFIRVAKHGKEPIDKDWPLNPMYADDPKLQEWLEDGGNYGVVGGKGLTIVDIDRQELKEIVNARLPPTFKTQSPRSNGWHLYYVCNLEKPIRLRDKDGENIGDIQGQGKQCVGPNSIHPNGGIYQIIDDKPFAQVTRTQLIDALKEYMIPDEETQIVEATAWLERKETNLDIYITEVLPLERLHKQGNEYYGPHPVHGSKTGKNFWVNLSKNCWHCFRHATGGGPLLWLAVKEGIINCEDAVPGALRGEVFKRVLEKMGEHGLIKNKPCTQKEAKEAEDKFFDENGTFQPVWFARDLMSRIKFKTTRDNETIYVYNEKTGIYHAIGANVIKEEMTKILGEEVRSRFYNDVAFYIQGQTYFDRPKNPPNKLVVFNGVLNVETGQLELFNSDEFLTIRIPVTHDPNTECPQTVKFITEVVGEDQVPIIQEWIGYCLWQAHPIHKALMLTGEGANGKSTLLNLIKKFLGSENVSAISLQALCENRFAPAQLYGKLANLCADLPDKSLSRTGMFKMLTGGDTVAAEQKFKDIFSYVNFAKLAFSTNKIPETHDDTIAFFRRWIIVTCNNCFPPEKADPNILEKTATPQELAGLLNWALKGLKKLLDKGDFSISKTFEELRSQYIAASNSAKAFIEECLEYNQSHETKIPEEELYRTYIHYCRGNNLPTMRKANFTQNMHQYLPEAKQTNARINGKTVHVWQHVKLVATVAGPLFNTKKSNLEKENKNLQLNREVATPATTSSVLLEETAFEVLENRENAFCYSRVKPGETCEFCGEFPIEFEITTEDDLVLGRCQACFEKMRRDFSKVKWLEEKEAL